MPLSQSSTKANRILLGYDDAFRRIENLISRLRHILSPDMLRILGYRLIQVADEIEPHPIMQGSAYGWQRARLVVRDVLEYRTVRLITELDESGYDERDIIDELQRNRVANRGGRLEWRADRLRAVLARERGRRSLVIGIEAPGSPLAAELPPNVTNAPVGDSAV